MNFQRKIIVTHIVTGLNLGGAETMLYNVLKNTNKKMFEHRVISLTGTGYYADKILDLGIPVYCFKLKSLDAWTSIKNIISICEKTDIIQTWMYHANFVGYLIGRKCKKKVVWGIHHSNLNFTDNKFNTIALAKVMKYASKKVDHIISCGDNVKKIHVDIGYAFNNHSVIFNGIDTEKFSLENKNNYLKENYPEYSNKRILLHVGRWDKLKDYDTLFQSLAFLKKNRNDFIFFMAGTSLNYENPILSSYIKSRGLEDYVVLLGRRDDIPTLMTAADIFVLSSKGEGLPNVLCEAMASGLYCVTTDVGDCANVVQEIGEISPPSNPEKLAQSIITALDLNKVDYMKRIIIGRKRALEHYSIKKVTRQYEKVYQEIFLK